VVEEDFPLWIAALETEFLPLCAVEQWADGQILRLDDPPLWLLDLSLTSSVETAAVLLWQGWSASAAAVRCNHAVGPEWGQSWLGFLYLRFERGEVGMAELLERAGRKSDVCECGIDCSAFYLLLNEIDGGGPTVPSDRPLAERVAERFAPFVARSRDGISRLPAVPAEPSGAADGGA
jgi:hypothetical protein